MPRLCAHPFVQRLYSRSNARNRVISRFVFAWWVNVIPILWAALFPMCAVLKAASEKPILSRGSEYIVRTWTTEEGLPQNSVTSIAQTKDGYLWLATFNGLVRFDGVRFVVFDSTTTPELPSSRIVKLHTDGRGQLW